MKQFWNWICEPFNKPQLELTTIDQFRMGLTILVGVLLIIGLIWLILTILEKIGVIK